MRDCSSPPGLVAQVHRVHHETLNSLGVLPTKGNFLLHLQREDNTAALSLDDSPCDPWSTRNRFI